MIHPYIYAGTFKRFMPIGKLTKEEIKEGVNDLIEEVE